MLEKDLYGPQTERDREVYRQLRAFLREYTGNENGYWYPLCVLRKEIPVVAYDLDRLYRDDRVGQIADVFRVCGIGPVNSFQMQFGSMRLLDEDMQKLLYGKDEDGCTFPWLVETFYFDNSHEWMVYVSHEGTIAFTGEQIATVAKAHIEHSYLWRGKE